MRLLVETGRVELHQKHGLAVLVAISWSGKLRFIPKTEVNIVISPADAQVQTGTFAEK